MLYCPKYSIGSLVTIGETKVTGKIIGFEAFHTENEAGEAYNVKYLVRIENHGVKKFMEEDIKDVKELTPGIVDEMDHFLADTLMLSFTSNPARVKNTLKELFKVGGIENGTKE